MVGEFINLQIGMLVAWSPVEVYMITPSAWKNHMKRHYGTNESLKLFDPTSEHGYVVHETDAMGIATYCFECEWKQRLLERSQHE